ncbi:MAG: phytanoyl-CoA dioxygenase [Rhodospirillales bacterium CG15_BIG_FIL_POST_REV_8_21_14_020_66_15]|nr:MAG: phytanoyl-CoA dioxygenase [Rhodospirillales bacterium CG15_BIG_FIL_POST_REV_8_21_14_020_66_15]
MIDDALAAAYRDKGYIIVADIYSPDDIREMQGALAELVEGARGLTDHTGVIDLEPNHTPDRPRVRRIKEPFKNHPVFNRMARHPRLMAVLTALLGPAFRMHGSKINLKSAQYGSPVEWHQDWAFYPHTNDDVLAVGVMLDDMTEDNGPLLCVPGSHKGPTYDHHQDGRFLGAMDPDAPGANLDTAEMITGRAGSCSFHHARTIHGSARNISGKDRTLLLYQVTAADAWDIRGLPAGSTWDDYVASFIAGEPVLEPRVVPTPVRLPYPPPLKGGSIYESQSLAKKKFFGAKTAAE